MPSIEVSVPDLSLNIDVELSEVIDTIEVDLEFYEVLELVDEDPYGIGEHLFRNHRPVLVEVLRGLSPNDLLALFTDAQKEVSDE